jgi:hypothetical protein
MNNNDKPINLFQEVHRRVRERLDHDREVRERETESQNERAKEEAIREGFDRA